MKRAEIAKMVATSPENIRFYRERGILHPKQLSNLYYDYSIDDLIFLYQTIEYKSIGYHPTVSEELNIDKQFIENAKNKIKEIDDEISRLKSLKDSIQKRLRHREMIDNVDSIKFVKMTTSEFLYINQYSLFENGIIARQLLESAIAAKVLQISKQDFIGKHEIIYPELTLELRKENYTKIKIDIKKYDFQIYKHKSEYSIQIVLCLPTIEKICLNQFNSVFQYLKDNNLAVSDIVRGIILKANFENKQKKYYVQFIIPVIKIYK